MCTGFFRLARRLRDFTFGRTVLLATCVGAASLVPGASAPAQELAPQPFLAPPQLREKEKLGTELALPSGAPTGCRPDGDITHDGNLVTLRLVAKVAPRDIRNPGDSNGGNNKVALPSRWMPH